MRTPCTIVGCKAEAADPSVKIPICKQHLDDIKKQSKPGNASTEDVVKHILRHIEVTDSGDIEYGGETLFESYDFDDVIREVCDDNDIDFDTIDTDEVRSYMATEMINALTEKHANK